MIIVRGTTPSISCDIPQYIPMQDASEVWFTLKQNGEMIADGILSEGTVFLSGQTVTVYLSQEQTLALRAGFKAALGIRILLNNGQAYASYDSEGVIVKDVVKGGVIE